MADQSYLDRLYFIDKEVYNCPFCNRHNVVYEINNKFDFDWTESKKCYGVLVKCSSCGNTSMHLSFIDITEYYHSANQIRYYQFTIEDIDQAIFYSVPTSFFIMDERIPRIIRELITEAEGCIKMNFLTGASACARKALYEFLVIEKANGDDYSSKIKSLKGKYREIDSELFDILSHIKDMTSDKVHEQSWDKWDDRNLKLIIETLKAVLHEVYVIPSIKAERSKQILALKQKAEKDRGEKKEEKHEDVV